jgi:uncharacterized membrane protein YeaQ/YmgE (transglycosylase-associated protein family)
MPAGAGQTHAVCKGDENAMVLLSAIPNLNFIPTSGPLDQIFHQTWLQFSILGFPHGGYRLNLIQLIIILIIALAANAITERLAGRKAGGLLLATLITVLGAALVEAYVTLPFDFALEGVRIIAALLGAVVIAVFYTLIRGQVSK